MSQTTQAKLGIDEIAQLTRKHNEHWAPTLASNRVD